LVYRSNCRIKSFGTPIFTMVLRVQGEGRRKFGERNWSMAHFAGWEGRKRPITAGLSAIQARMIFGRREGNFGLWVKLQDKIFRNANIYDGFESSRWRAAEVRREKSVYSSFCRLGEAETSHCCWAFGDSSSANF